jgi:ferredoxin
MDYRIRIHSQTKDDQCHAAAGTNLREFLQQNNYELYTPCNGKGTCGKCRVRLSGAVIPEPTPQERNVFDPAALTAGYRLACRITINQALNVYLEGANLQAQVLTEGKPKELRLAPAVTKRLITLAPPINVRTANV